MSACGCVYCHHTQPQNISGIERQRPISPALGSAGALLHASSLGKAWLLKLHCWRQHWLTWQGREHSVSRPVCKRRLPGVDTLCSRSTGSLARPMGSPNFHRWTVAMQWPTATSEPCEQPPGMTTYGPHPKCQ